MKDEDIFDKDFGVRQKIKNWAKGIISDVKDAFGIHSPSTVMRDEVGKYLALGTAQGLAENDKAVVKQFKAMLEKLDYQRDFDIISESEYYASLEELKDKYFAKGTQNWVKYTEKVYSYQQKLIENEKKRIEEQKKLLEKEKKSITGIYDDISNYALAQLEKTQNRTNQLAARLSDVGRMYSLNKVTINDMTDEYYSLRDLNKDIEKIRLYSELMTSLKERMEALGIDEGIQREFSQAIREMDIEAAIGVANSLDIAGDKTFAEYISAWNTKQKLAEGVSAKQYEDDFRQSWENAYDYMCEELEKAGYEIPEGFFTTGSISAEKFGQAFVDGIDEQMEKIRKKIEEFNESIAFDVNIEPAGGNIYNTSNTSYNISADSGDTVEQIRRYETVKRLSGVV